MAGGYVGAVAGSPAHLELETSDAQVHAPWYKNGMELGCSCRRFSQEDVGTRHWWWLPQALCRMRTPTGADGVRTLDS